MLSLLVSLQTFPYQQLGIDKLIRWVKYHWTPCLVKRSLKGKLNSTRKISPRFSSNLLEQGKLKSISLIEASSRGKRRILYISTPTYITIQLIARTSLQRENMKNDKKRRGKDTATALLTCIQIGNDMSRRGFCPYREITICKQQLSKNYEEIVDCTSAYDVVYYTFLPGFS